MNNFDNGRFDLHDLIQKAAENKNALETREGMENFIDRNLSGQQAEKLKSILADENKIRAILESREAQELLKKLTGGGNNG